MKTILITGSSASIGLEIARKFAKNNYNVVINGRNEENLKKAFEEVSKISKNVLALKCDVSNFTECEKMVENALSYFKIESLDILVNNAGISKIGLFTEMKQEDFSYVLNNNLISALNCSQIALKNMIKVQDGKIINISSIWGEVGASCEVLYSASKGAMNAFTKSLAKEVAPSNIYVNAISCGVIDTNMNAFLTDEEREELQNQIPLNRFGTTEEIANIAFFLAEKESYITGQIIRADGGLV